MMYLKVRWLQDSPDYPTLLYSELDADLWEVRKVDVYADGRMDFADGTEETGSTGLSTEPVPPIEEIAAIPELEPAIVSAEEFEAVWKMAKAKHRSIR